MPEAIARTKSMSYEQHAVTEIGVTKFHYLLETPDYSHFYNINPPHF
jgi:hypothetical protein